jgi:hypothetical protein
MDVYRLFVEPSWEYRHINKKDKSTTNSVKKDKTQNDTFCIAICLFCFSSCVSNLVLKILGNANTHLVNIHRFVSNIFNTSKFKF